MKRLKPSPLAKRSKKKIDWEKKYWEAREKDGPMVKNAVSGNVGHQSMMDCHHVFGRRGQNILRYVYVSKTFHEWIHEHSITSYSQGWLSPEYRGEAPNLNHPMPWKQGTLYDHTND